MTSLRAYELVPFDWMAILMSARHEVIAPSGVIDREQEGAGLRRPDPEDAVLVAMLRSGHPNAAATFFDRYGAYVERLLVRVLGPDPDIEDLLHDVFVDALTQIDQLRDPNKLKAWLTRITVFAARTMIRKRSRWRFLQFRAPENIPEPAAPDASEEAKALLREVEGIMARLRPDERICFSLRYFDEMTLPEIVEATSLSLATVKRKIKRAEVCIHKIIQRRSSFPQERAS